jgi:hypothetical protein
MSDTIRLVRHPAPNPTESLYGYILRLAEENGYASWHSVFLLAGMPRSDIGAVGITVAKLARIANRSEQELEPIRYRSPGMSSGRCRILANPLLKSDLRLKNPQICPECLMEKGYIGVHFDLTLVTACPVHRKVLLSACPTCLQPLRWSRPGLLKCQCGASLFTQGKVSISPAEADLLDIVRRKVLGLPGNVYCSGLPTRDLQAMSLLCLVQLINTLGKCHIEEQNETNLADCGRIVHSAANVLTGWPENFNRLLEQLTEDIPSNLQLAQGPLKAIYYLAAKCIRPTEHAQFVRNALSDFSAAHGGRTFRDSKQKVEPEHRRQFVSITEFAQQHGIKPHTVARYIRIGQIASIQFKRGGLKHLIVDNRRVTLPIKTPGKIYGLGTAAKLIGIPRRVLRELKASGDFEVKHLPRVMPGVHELDVQSFIEKLLSLATPQASSHLLSQDVIQFNLIASSHYGPYSRIAAKAIIIRLLLSKKLPVIGSSDGTVGGLLVSEHDLQHCARRWTLRETAPLLR